MQANNIIILADKVESLEEENTKLKDENLQLKGKNSQLQKENQEQKNEIEELQLSKQRNREEKKWLFLKNQKLHARICHQDCVLCAVVWFCAKELNLPHVCGRQLEKIILVTTLRSEDIEIEQKDLVKCSGLLKILEKCKIVTLASEYKYPPNSEGKEARNNKIAEAWNGLMSIDGGELHVFLGRIPEAKVPGHIEVCDLAKRADGRATIHDPQTNENSFEGDQEDFRKHVIDDAKLRIYTVKWPKLIQLIKCYDDEDILHCAQICTSNEKCTHACAAKAKNG